MTTVINFEKKIAGRDWSPGPAQRFGRLIAVRNGRRDPRGRRRWHCVCDCGKPTTVYLFALRRGTTQSCGCLWRERMIEAGLGNEHRLMHGEARRGSKGQTAEYRTWRRMIERCENAANDSFEYYGGRGIKVCKRWRASFPAFLADMGRKPTPGHSLDRINNDGDYKPSNCRWSTASVQNNNRRKWRK